MMGEVQAEKDQIVKASASEYKRNIKRKRNLKKLTRNLYRFLIFLSILVFWQAGVSLQLINPFLIGSPINILKEWVVLIQNGQLFSNTFATVYGTLIGFIIGSILGSIVGLLLWFSKELAKIIDPFVIALNGLPKIALAPMIIIWFGSGITSKIALAIIATFVVALLSAYQGTHQIDGNLIRLMQTFGASKFQIFRKIIVPSTLPWVISAFRLNIGFALISVIGGEFISSDVGLGKMIFVAGNLFNLNIVWVGVLMIMLVAIVLYMIISYLETKLIPWSNKEEHNLKNN